MNAQVVNIQKFDIGMLSRNTICGGVNSLNQNAGEKKERSDDDSFEAEPSRYLEPVGY